MTVNGSFTDPGADAPWSYAFAWGNGMTTGTLTASGSTVSANRQYNTAGNYTIAFTVAPRAGAWAVAVWTQNNAATDNVARNANRTRLTLIVTPRSKKTIKLIDKASPYYSGCAECRN